MKKLSEDEKVMKNLVDHIKSKGHGIFALTPLAKNKKNHPALAQVINAGGSSHGKFANIIQEIAAPLGFDVEVKTVFIINKKKKGT